MGFLKKIKDTAEKGMDKGVDLGKQGVEKGAEIGTKAYDGTKDAAKKGVDKAKKTDSFSFYNLILYLLLSCLIMVFYVKPIEFLFTQIIDS